MLKGLHVSTLSPNIFTLPCKAWMSRGRTQHVLLLSVCPFAWKSLEYLTAIFFSCCEESF